ncbi:Hypothetical protein FKW44_006880 [Caligus rogercresseyi]|uniref:Uncharacterized protein n=1 Tax=Caligus rogercresseyi TaxID=217165 RepID=A0A7T8KDY1_CALRO|nr:Hypothetical protein FKW44_006880 [Caligus rogercresseyi]
MREVQQKKTQTKISDFFKAGPSPAEKRSRTESETSSVSVTSTSSTNLPNLSSGSSSSLLQDIPYTPEPSFNEFSDITTLPSPHIVRYIEGLLYIFLEVFLRSQ